MNTENEHAYFNCQVLMDTERAVQVNIDKSGRSHWVPKSLCEVKKHPTYGYCILEVEEWFAKKEGLGEG